MASGFQFRWSGFISSQLGEVVSLVRHFHMSAFPDIFVMLQVLFKREHQIVSCGKVKVHNNFSKNQIWPKSYFFFSPRTGNAYKFSECCGDKCCKKDQKEVSLSYLPRNKINVKIFGRCGNLWVEQISPTESSEAKSVHPNEQKNLTPLYTFVRDWGF